jgi:hypothetical protein
VGVEVDKDLMTGQDKAAPEWKRAPTHLIPIQPSYLLLFWISEKKTSVHARRQHWES